jgi:tRNA dimethylallyltransferase
MDIGTAKPTPTQQATVRHHLIDVVDPHENLTLAEYQDRANQAIHDIHTRYKVPFLVGGTGQYITAVEEGWSIPRVPPNLILRAELENFAQTNGAEALHARLVALDPDYAQRTHPNNVRRVIRALEVCLETNDTMTHQQQKQPPPFRIRIIGLTLPRETLYQRADVRVDHMMQEGFLAEVQALLDNGYGRNLPSMSGLGYLELSAHLLDGLPLDEAVTKTKFNTHDFIRRQDVWFRGHDNGILWHNNETMDIDRLIQSLREWLEEA